MKLDMNKAASFYRSNSWQQRYTSTVHRLQKLFLQLWISENDRAIDYKKMEENVRKPQHPNLAISVTKEPYLEIP